MKRVVEAEWLDELAADDPGAIGSRRDLQRLNRVMGHARVLGELLRAGMGRRPLKRLVELGAGDGRLALAVAERLGARWPGVEVTLVDCKDAVNDATRAKFAALGWHANVARADVFEWLRDPGGEMADAMMANLFLHQFPATGLAEMLKLAAGRTRIFAACEPRRAKLPLLLSRMVGLIGCNAVTRHDAVLSVKAGFAGNEISALWPAGWHCRERSRRLSHFFLAERSA
jgi:hypothetical protein